MIENLGETEVDEHNLVLRNVIHNILRFNIKMDNSSLMASMNHLNDRKEDHSNKIVSESSRAHIEELEEIFSVDEIENLEHESLTSFIGGQKQDIDESEDIGLSAQRIQNGNFSIPIFRIGSGDRGAFESYGLLSMDIESQKHFRSSSGSKLLSCHQEVVEHVG